MASRPTIAFLTDFGTRDHYAGAMKGAALSICPEATLVDITHDIEPHDVLGGALELAAAFRYFPPETVFVAVVDPGVGTVRRGIAARVGAYRFVAPDNGLLTLVLRDVPQPSVVELSDRHYAHADVSRTFEGRDRFAPAAAWLARGTDLTALGRAVREWVELTIPRPQVSANAVAGEVLRVDRFGNLVTNIDRRAVEAFARGEPVSVSVGREVIANIVGTYGDVPPGAICALFGSSDHLEIALNAGSAAGRLGLARGAAVALQREPKNPESRI
jgi:S-adenosylmethionine hydrolase